MILLHLRLLFFYVIGLLFVFIFTLDNLFFVFFFGLSFVFTFALDNLFFDKDFVCFHLCS